MSTQFLRCQCCKELFSRSEFAAYTYDGHRTRGWCLPCWDSDPRAVEQYRSTPYYTKLYKQIVKDLVNHSRLASPSFSLNHAIDGIGEANDR